MSTTSSAIRSATRYGARTSSISIPTKPVRNMELARAEVIRSGRAVTLDTEIRTWRGESRWMRLSINAVEENGRPVRIFGAKQDITSDREAMESLRRQAETDPLTGLPNRSVFQALYREVVADSF